MFIYLAWEAQIGLLLTKEINISKKYIDFLDIFSKKSVTIILKYLDINKHIINLKTDK